MNTVGARKDVGPQEWGQLATSALASSIHAQLADAKHTFVSIRPGEGAAAFKKMLIATYGEAAMLIPNNPALRHVVLIIRGAGNDLCYSVGRNKRYSICLST